MNQKEAELVNEEYVTGHNTYNLCCGGKGGFSYINKTVDTKDRAVNIQKTIQQKYSKEEQSNWGIHARSVLQRKWDVEGYHPNFLQAAKSAFKGKHHTDKSKAIIGKKNSVKQTGKGNSQFGTCWITNGISNKKIKLDNLTKYLSKGFVRGRTMNRRQTK